MNTTFPATRHALLWVLTDLVGLNRREIARRSGLSPVTIERVARGHQPSDDALERLRTVLREAEPTRRGASTSRLTLAPEYVALEQAVQQVIGALIVAPLESSQATRRQHLNTELRRSLHHLLKSSPSPVPKSYAIAHLNQGWTSKSIRRAAEYLRVVSTFDPERRLLWSLPPDAPPLPPSTITLTRPRFAPPPPHTRFRAAYDALADLLAVTPGNILRARDIRELLPQFSRLCLDRAADGLCLIRETTGFGSSKQTTWQLRPPGAVDPPAGPTTIITDDELSATLPSTTPNKRNRRGDTP